MLHMKLLSAAIFQICLSSGKGKPHTDEYMATCFDKYVNCTIKAEDSKAYDPEVVALKRLNHCQYNTVR